jgi:hypothetical protein
MARTFRGEFRPASSGTWLPLFSGQASATYAWNWEGSVPPGEYHVRVQATDDGVDGPWSAHVVFGFSAPPGAISQVHVLCGDVIVEAADPGLTYGAAEATRFRFYLAGTATVVYTTAELTDPAMYLRGAASGVLPLDTDLDVTFAARFAGVWSPESDRVPLTTRNCVAAGTSSYRLAHLELHSDVAAAGGVRLAVTRRVLSAVERMSLSPAEERVTVDLPLLDAFAKAIVEMQVLRPVFLNGTWSEWRIVKATEGRDESNALLLQVECESIRYDLGNGVATRALEDGSVQHQWEEHIALGEHVGRILEDAPSYFIGAFVVGAGRPTYPGAPSLLTPIWFTHQSTPLEQLTQLAEQEEMEVEVSRRLHDNHYSVQVVKERGSSLQPVRLLHGRNISALRRVRDAESLVTAVYPAGPDVDGWRQGIEGAQWEVVAVDSTTAGAHRIQMADGPIEFDDQFGGSPAVVAKYLELAGTTTRKLILDTIRDTQEIVVGDAAGITAGALVVFRLDADGTALTFLERPDAISVYGYIRAPAHFDDIPPVDNLVGNAYGAETGEDGMPAGFGKVGTPSVTASNNPLYTRYGGQSWIVDAPTGEGITTAWYPIAPTDRRPYASSAGKVWVFSGTVKQTTRFRDAAGNVAAKTVNTGTLVNAWTDGDKGLYDAGVNIYDHVALSLAGPVVEFQVQYTADGGASRFAWDAVLVCQDPAPPEEFYDGLASNALFRLGNKRLRDFGWRRYTYEVTPRDLHRSKPGTYPQDKFVLGGPATVFDPEIEPGATVRISEVQHDWLTPDVTTLRLDTKPAVLLDPTISRTMVPRRAAGTVEGGTPPAGSGAISGVAAALISAGQVRVSWAHNDVVAAAAAGTFTVDVLTEDSVYGVQTMVAGRDPKLEHGGTDTAALQGSWTDMYPACGSNPEWICEAVTRTYTVHLKQGGAVVSTGSAVVTVTMAYPEFL